MLPPSSSICRLRTYAVRKPPVIDARHHQGTGVQLTPRGSQDRAGIGRRRSYAGRLDPLRPVPRIWARLAYSPHEWWHRIAWQRHEAEHAELVALCGRALLVAASEQSASRGVPGRRCVECAIRHGAKDVAV